MEFKHVSVLLEECLEALNIKEGDVIEILFGTRSVKARVLNVQETVRKEEAKDMHLAVDSCIDKIEKQLKKQREKNREHKPKSIRHGGQKTEEGMEEDDYTAKVVETRKVVLKLMSLEEAVLEMEGSKARFLIYRDTASEKVSLVYRLDDGNIAHIETNS